jgi:hypothetical protein
VKADRGSFRMLSRKQLLQEVVHDAYQARRKPGEVVRCRSCSAVYRRGRWTKGVAGGPARGVLCPACRRARERLPSGFVTLSGPFLSAHRGEIVALVKGCEARESSRHVLERIIELGERPGGLLVTTTGIHLARRIGDALQHAYKGRLRYRYNKADKLIRVSWSR